MKLLKVPFIPSPLTKKSRTSRFPWLSERISLKDWSSDTYWNLLANEKLNHMVEKKIHEHEESEKTYKTEGILIHYFNKRIN